MTGDVIRMGYISTYEENSGMASIYYPDRDPNSATSKMPVFAPFGIPQSFKKDDEVMVFHLSNGTEVAVVMGTYTAEGGNQKVSIKAENNDIVFSLSEKSITLSEIIHMKEVDIPALYAAIGD